MKNYLLYQLLATAFLLTFFGSGTAAAQDDLKALQGTWTVASYSMLGRPVDPKSVEGKKWIFSGEELVWQDGSAKQHRTIKLDPTKSPKWIDLTLHSGSESSVVHKAVYQLDGDILKVCSGATGARPDAVESKPGTHTESFVLKREGAAAAAKAPPEETKRPSRPNMPARMASVRGEGEVKKVDDELFIELSNGKKYLSREEKTTKVCREFLGKGTLSVAFSAWDTKTSDEWAGVLFSIRKMELAEGSDQ